MYFCAIPGVQPFEEAKNAATWMMAAVKAARYDLAELYTSSVVAEANLKLLRSVVQPQGESVGVAPHYQATLWVQFQMLLLRWLRLQWRSPEYNGVRLVTVVLITCTEGSMFFPALGGRRSI
eukprot:EG_transcript_44685